MKASSTLADEQEKKITHVSLAPCCAGGTLTPCPRAGLVVRRAPPLREGEGLGPVDGPLVLQVGLVPDNHNRDVLVVLDADNVVAEPLEFLKRRSRGDAEDQEEALPRFHVEIAHGHYRASATRLAGSWTGNQIDRTELLRASGIETGPMSIQDNRHKRLLCGGCFKAYISSITWRP